MINVVLGDVIRFDLSWEYRGPAYTQARARSVIGVRSLLGIFDEVMWADTAITISKSVDWTALTFSQMVTFNKKVALINEYDVYVKIYEGTKIYVLWSEDRALKLMGQPEFQNLRVTYAKA